MIALTEEQAEYVKSIIPGKLWNETSALFKEKYGIDLSRNQIKYLRQHYKIKSGMVGGRFMKGQPSHNKGKTWDELGISKECQRKMLETTYKKGNIPHNGANKPIGAERITKDGYIEVKIAERPSKKDCNDNWCAKQRLEYERLYGEKVPKGYCVLFADHNPRNFNKENLVMVDRKYIGMLNKKDVEYGDRETLLACIKYLDLVMGINQKLMAERECSACGKVFKPEYKTQRRCRECIDKDRPAKKKAP